MIGNRLTLFYRFVMVSIFTVALMIFDHRTTFFESTRTFLSNINTPLNMLLTVPVKARTFLDIYWPNEQLLQRVRALEFENQHLLAKVQTLDALEIEKNRLLALFSASRARGDTSVKLARIIRTSLQGQYDQRIVIDRGRRDNVVNSQAVIDSNGVIGQVSMIARDHSVVTVITDSAHAVPVEVLRNGLNAIVRGTGANQELSIPFMSFQADIEVGDVLVTSGLGNVFPLGYPVAEVVDIQGLAGEPFLTVKAQPFAELDKVKNVLLLESAEPINRALNSHDTPISDSVPEFKDEEKDSDLPADVSLP